MSGIRHFINIVVGTPHPLLTEARYRGVPLLYHSTYPDGARSIIESGKIETQTTANINGRYRKGVSLTRSATFALAYETIIFGFDAEKIRRRFGGLLVPFADQTIGFSDYSDARREAEEFLMAELPLADFQVALWISSEPTYDMDESERLYFQTHPLYAGYMRRNHGWS
jgi:hypothetical protein